MDFGTINVLNEYGLVIPDHNSWCDYRAAIGQPHSPRPNAIRLLHANRHWVLAEKDAAADREQVRQSGVALSKAGRELAAVVEFIPNERYLAGLRDHFKSQGLQLVEAPT